MHPISTNVSVRAPARVRAQVGGEVACGGILVVLHRTRGGAQVVSRRRTQARKQAPKVEVPPGLVEMRVIVRVVLTNSDLRL